MISVNKCYIYRYIYNYAYHVEQSKMRANERHNGYAYEVGKLAQAKMTKL